MYKLRINVLYFYSFFCKRLFFYFAFQRGNFFNLFFPPCRKDRKVAVANRYEIDVIFDI
jgi:hypothetical protein